MNINYKVLTRPAAVLSALALLVGTAAPSIIGATAEAAQLFKREIQLSDASPSGGSITSGVGSGTAVKYQLKFTTAQTSWQSMVVDFCDASPLINDTCSAPTGMDSSAATLTPLTDWSLSASASHWSLTAATSKGAATYTFELNGITNPSTVGPFYARITLYSDNAHASYVSATNAGTYLDYGGVAMSITQTITVTARVMETLSLCTSGGVAGTNANNLTAASSCGSATTPAVTLGSAPNYVLGYVGATPSSANVYTQLSTNAGHGYALWLRAANNACSSGSGGLSRDNGSSCEIPPINSGGATSTTFTNNTAEFGAHVSNGVAATGGSGANTAVTRWAGPNWIMDTTTGSDNVIGTYGSKIAEATVATGDPLQANSVNNTISFAAVAAPVTPAGIYSENFSLIGVGTF